MSRQCRMCRILWVFWSEVMLDECDSNQVIRDRTILHSYGVNCLESSSEYLRVHSDFEWDIHSCDFEWPFHCGSEWNFTRSGWDSVPRNLEDKRRINKTRVSDLDARECKIFSLLSLGRVPWIEYESQTRTWMPIDVSYYNLRQVSVICDRDPIEWHSEVDRSPLTSDRTFGNIEPRDLRGETNIIYRFLLWKITMNERVRLASTEDYILSGGGSNLKFIHYRTIRRDAILVTQGDFSRWKYLNCFLSRALCGVFRDERACDTIADFSPL